MTKLYRLDSEPDEPEHEHLRATLQAMGWERSDGDEWTLSWSSDLPDASVYRSLGPHQRVNHFPGVRTLHFKDELYHFLAMARERSGDKSGWYDFFPTTYSMPQEHGIWLEAFDTDPTALWICKPKRLAEGRDVAMVIEPSDVDPRADVVVQRYVDDPLLLPGRPYKHTMRLYVLVTSLDPLVAYLHSNGPVKFTSRPYGTAPAQLRDMVVHATNPRIQRTNTDVTDPIRSIDQHEYKRLLESADLDHSLLWERIRRTLVLTLLAHREPVLRVSSYLTDQVSSCFELLGFDVMVDSALQPWVIECNMSPALGVRGAEGSPHREAQRRAKHAMIEDTLRVVGAEEEHFPAGLSPARFAAESSRGGGYQVLYPAADAPSYRVLLGRFAP